MTGRNTDRREGKQKERKREEINIRRKGERYVTKSATYQIFLYW